MKKSILFVLIILFPLGTTTAIASKTDPKAKPESSVVSIKTNDNLSVEEINRITKRVEEIRRMDKSNLTIEERKELRNELQGYRHRGYGHRGYGHRGGVVFIGGGSLVLIIILILLLA